MTAENESVDDSAHARIFRLYEIARLMLTFHDVESSIDDALAVAAKTLALRTVILIDVSGEGPRIFRWPAVDHNTEPIRLAEAHARSIYDMLLGKGAAQSLSLDARSGTTELPKSAPELRVPGDTASRFIALPLLLQSDQIFGVLQVEAAERLERSDLTFVNTLTDMFAIALDRSRMHRLAESHRVQAERADEAVREQLAVMRAMAESLIEGVVATDAQGKITFFNHAASVLLQRAESAARGAQAQDVMFVGGAIESPITRVLRTGARLRSEELTLMRQDGSGFSADVNAAPIERDGDLTGAVLAFTDISDRKRAQRGRAFLLNAEQALRGLDVQVLLKDLAAVSVPTLGDLCLFYLLLPTGEVACAAWSHSAPAGQALLDAALGGGRPVALLDHPISAITASRSELITPVDGRWIASSGDAGDLVRKLGVQSAMIVPITRKQRVLGALSFFSAESSRHFDGLDLQLAEDLAHRASLSMENCRMYGDAQRAIRTRDQVLEVVAHDLKTPLATIMLASEMQHRGRDPDAQAAAASAKITNAVALMQRLIDDLLDYASLDAGTLSMRTGVHEVAPLLKDSLFGVEALAHARNIHLSSTVADDVPRVRCDRDRALQVLANLLGNAVKITPPRGAVVVSARSDGPRVILLVTDTGPGIAPTHAARLFDRFWRDEGVAYKGTGLGLAIAKGIVEAHGGRIWVESKPGEGAVFAFTLPAETDDRGSA